MMQLESNILQAACNDVPNAAHSILQPKEAVSVHLCFETGS